MRDSKQATYIRTIARLRSISTAAEQLNMSQPALSSYLKKAEARLGTTLFDRSSTPISLTEAGRTYLDYEREAEALEKDFERKLSDIANLKCGDLVIGGTASFNIAYLAPAIAKFTEQYPGIRIRIIDDTTPNITRMASEGTVDLFITAEPPDVNAFKLTAFRHEQIFLCLPAYWDENIVLEKRQAQRGHSRIEAQDFNLLKNRTFITLSKNQQLGREIRKLFALCDLKPTHIIQVGQATTSLALTTHGIGASLATESTLHVLAGNQTLLATYPLDESIHARTLYIAQPTNHYTSLATEKFIGILLENADETVAK